MRLLERYIRTRDALSQINGTSAGKKTLKDIPALYFDRFMAYSALLQHHFNTVATHK
jgi:hypothetical protein